MSEFDDAVVASMKPNPAQAARVGFSAAVDSNPDSVAEAKRVAQRTGVPIDTVLNMPDEMKRQDAVGSVDFETLAQTSPATAALLADVDKARLSHDNVDSLSGIENALSFLGGSAKAGLNDLAGAGAKLVDALNPFTLSEQDAAVLYKNQPDKLKQLRDNSLTMGLSRFARERTDASQQNMQDISPGAQAEYGNLKYATTDPSQAAYLSPVKVIGDAIRSLPTTAALAVTAYLTRGASVQAEKQALAAGMEAAAAKQAGVDAAVNMAAKFGAASEGSVGYAQQALQTQNQIEGVPEDKIAASPAYQELVSKGFDPSAARIYLAARAGEQSGILAGGVDAATNLVGGQWLGKIIGEGGALLPRVAKGFSNEGAVEFAQSGGEQLAQNMAVRDNADPTQSLSDGVLESMLQGLAVGGLTGGAFSGVIGRGQRDGQKAQDAEQGAAMLDKLNQLASADKLLQRDPETFQTFIAAAAEDGPVQNVFIDGKTLMQSGMAQALAELSPAVREQLDRSILTGGMIAIPVDEYAARIAPTEFAPQLLDHLKTDAEGFSRAEAADFMANQGAELQAEVERVIGNQADADTFRASQDVVKADILGQLNTAGRFTPQVNEAYATLASAYSAVRAAQLGMTPEAFHAERGMRVQGAAVSGDKFDQTGKLVIDTPEFANWFGESKVKDADGKPLVVFHGSGESIGAFDPSKSNTGAFFFTANPSYAASHAAQIKGLEGGYLNPSYLALKNPKTITATDADFSVPGYEREQIAIAKAEGHDGVIFQGSKNTFYAAFDSRQVKSYNNKGTFDPADPNILNQSGNPTGKDSFTVRPPKKLYRGVAKGVQQSGADGIGTYMLGKGLYSSPSKRFAKMYGEVVEVSAEEYFPRNPLVLDQPRGYSAPDVFRDWLFDVHGFKNLREFNAKYPDPGDFVRSLGYDGVVIGDEIVRYPSDNILNQSASQNGAVTLRALADEGNNQAILAQALVDRAGFGPKQFADVLEGAALGTQPDGLVSVPAFASMLSHMRSAVLDDLKVLDAIVGSVPVDMVNNLAGSESAAKVLLHDEAMNEDSPAFNADLMVSNGVDAPNPVGLLVREAALAAAKVASVTLNNGRESSEAGAAIFAGDGNSFSQSARLPRAAFHPSTNTITLLDNADLTSFLHESAHYFFESDIQLASELLGKESLTPGEQQIVDDVSRLLTWHGIQGDVTEQLRQWHTMDFEEQRSHHERTAESFEAYLFSGQAPNLELQPIFQRFRAWMVNVYKSITEFLKRNPEAGKLNDGVRSVFDRMIATQEQIQLAEQARSLTALFASPETSGMTPEAYAAYHALGVDATNTAIEELQAKGLRDMQWLANARGRAVKKLQKESKAARAEVTMEARREVMSQPVYRAWDFLTRKMSDNDKLPALERKSDPDVLDPTLDSLFVAIAKLGGVRKDQVLSEWGVDPKDMPQSGLFGKPVWRLKDGLTLDGMASALAEHGYLPVNEHGQYERNDLGDKFLEELAGNTQYAYAYQPQDLQPGEQIANPAGLMAGRLDIAGLDSIGVPDEVANALKARKMTARDGLHPDLAATILEFSSGDELVRALAAAPSPKDAINTLAEQMMLERFGELATPDAIERAADAAIHNDVRGRMLTTEANALSQAIGRPKILASAAKAFAADMIARLKVRDIRPGQYANAEARAAKAAEKARATDPALAASEKRNQAIQHYATRAAYDAQDEVKSGLDYVRRRITSSTSQKNMRGEARAQLLALLDRFDLRKSLSLAEIDRQQSLVEWAASEADRLAAPPPILSPEAADEGKRTHYKNLTVEEFRGLIDSIKQLEHLARREHKAYLAIREMSLQEEVANAVAEIREAWPAAFDADGKAKTETPLTHRYAKTFGDKLTEGLRHLNAEFVPMEELVGQLTAGKFGLLSESLFGRISGASDRKSIMAGEIRDRLAPAYAAYTFQEKRDFSRKVVGDTGMTRENLLMLALYYGNVEGRQRLASQGFSDQVVLARLSNLTEKDLNLAEAIWSLNDDYIWPQYAALNERTQGKAPAKVQAAPMQINGRDLKGGYVKLVYDSQFDEKTRHRDSMADAMAMIGGRANQSAKTNQGSSIERVQEIAKMPLLELRAMSQAVNEHMHDIAYREAVADTVRVLRETDMANAIKAVAGKEVYTELLAKVNEVAARPAEPTSMVLKGLNLARKNTVVVLMSGVRTALINYSGLVPALFDNRINAAALVKNIAKVHSPRMREMVAFAMEKSIYMRERNQQFTSDLQHEMASLTVKNRLLPEMGTFLILMRTVDQITSTSVWLAGYEAGKKAYPDDDARAIEYANSTVRSTQAGGRDVDTSKIMTRFGPWSKPFLMFYSFFNRQLGLLVRGGVIARQTWERGNKAKAVGQFTAAYISIIVIPALINDLASGRCDDAIETGEGWGKCVSKAIAMNMAGFIPVVRDLAPYAWGMMDDSAPNFGLRSTALTAYFEGVIKGTASVVDVAWDEGDEKDTKSIFMGLAYLFGLPGKLMWDVTAGTEAVINDDAPPQSILFGPPKD